MMMTLCVEEDVLILQGTLVGWTPPSQTTLQPSGPTCPTCCPRPPPLTMPASIAQQPDHTSPHCKDLLASTSHCRRNRKVFFLLGLEQGASGQCCAEEGEPYQCECDTSA